MKNNDKKEEKVLLSPNEYIIQRYIDKYWSRKEESEKTSRKTLVYKA